MGKFDLNFKDCCERIRNYNTINEFISNNQELIQYMKDNDYIDELFFNSTKSDDYWTKQNCFKAGLMCSNIDNFKTKFKNAFIVSKENDWIEEIKKIIKISTQGQKIERNYLIYVYEDNINNYAYVGLTKTIKERDRQHNRKQNGKYDSVGEHFRKYNIPVPKPIIIYNNLTLEEASLKEIDAYYEYKVHGWNMINSESALGTIGGSDKLWTYETCLIESLDCKTKADFFKKNRTAYLKARDCGWLKTFDWIKPAIHPFNYWNEETCREESKKYKTKREFRLENLTAYLKARENKWLKDYTWLISETHSLPPNYWTEERCREIALTCKTKIEFYEKNYSAYTRARTNGWLEKFSWLSSANENNMPPNYWNEETCLKAALKFTTIKDFIQENRTAYEKAKDNGWLESYTWLKHHYKYPHGYWTKERCIEESKKYTTRKEFQESCPSAHKKAERRGWIKTYTWLRNGHTSIWTEEKCREEAMKYTSFKEFRENNKTAFRRSRDKGWAKSYTWLKKK